jgi:hypothetical protein
VIGFSSQPKRLREKGETTLSLKSALEGSGAGARSADLSEAGAKVAGVVTYAGVRPAKKFQSEVIDTWDDGTEKEQAVIVVQTDLDEGPDEKGRADDGRRAVYIKLWGAQKRALLEALDKADLDDVSKGDYFAAKFVGVGPKDPTAPKGYKAPNVFRYLVRAGAVTVAEVEVEEVEEVDEPALPPARPAARPAARRKPVVVENDDDF